MTFTKRILTIGLVGGLFLSGCEGSFDSLVEERIAENPLYVAPAPTGSKGSADFTTYVAIGNSLTAGYMDGALYNLGQSNSFPALLAKQFAYAGGGAFNQPSINSANGYNTSVQVPALGVLGRFKLDTSIPGPSPVLGGDAIAEYAGNKATLNNFGVPGIQVGQLLTAGTGTPGNPAFNPFYARFASAPGTSTIIGDVIARQPTFFTLWIGSNDVLGYAMSGATNDAIFTSVGDFQTRFGAVVNALMTNTTAKGVVADIPLIIAAPYFRAVPYNAIPLDQATAGALTAQFTPLNTLIGLAAGGGLITAQEAALRQFSFSAGANGIMTVDDNLTDLGPFFDGLLAQNQIDAATRAGLEPYRQARQLTTVTGVGAELALLSAATVLGTPAVPGSSTIIYGVSYPVGDQYTLTYDEIVELETARQTFNGIMEATVAAANAAAGSTRLGLYKTSGPDSYFSDLFGFDGKLGVTVSGVNLAPDFSPNGVASTDGIHPNSRGNALIANDFIKVIEETFGASLPDVDVLSLPSVQICAGDCVSQQSAGKIQ